MGKFAFLDKIDDDEALKFKRCIRKLLDATFIVQDREPALFDYLTYSSNRVDISNYLQVMGYDLYVNDEFKYAMLIQNFDDADVSGLRVMNHHKFSNKEIMFLLVFWLLFLERFGKSDRTYVNLGDAIDLVNQYEIHLSPNEMRKALAKFRRFSLLNYSDTPVKEDTIITLYPTLQFALNQESFIALVQKMKKELIEGDRIEDEAQEEEDIDE